MNYGLWFMKVIDLANVTFKYEFCSMNRDNRFNDYLVESDHFDEEIIISDERAHEFTCSYNLNNWNDEIFFVLDGAVNKILKYNKAFYHGVAVKIHNKCYLITAPSGTGKTTQYRNLRSLYTNEIKIINGDKPILDFSKKDIWLYSSPWTGKEGYGEKTDARLDGIIILSQGSTNTIQRLSPHAAILHILAQFLYNAYSVKDIETICRMTEQILKSVPIWYYTNTGTLESSRLLYDTLIRYQEGNQGE